MPARPAPTCYADQHQVRLAVVAKDGQRVGDEAQDGGHLPRDLARGDRHARLRGGRGGHRKHTWQSLAKFGHSTPTAFRSSACPVPLSLSFLFTTAGFQSRLRRLSLQAWGGGLGRVGVIHFSGFVAGTVGLRPWGGAGVSGLGSMLAHGREARMPC